MTRFGTIAPPHPSGTGEAVVNGVPMYEAVILGSGPAATRIADDRNRLVGPRPQAQLWQISEEQPLADLQLGCSRALHIPAGAQRL